MIFDFQKPLFLMGFEQAITPPRKSAPRYRTGYIYTCVCNGILKRR